MARRKANPTPPGEADPAEAAAVLTAFLAIDEARTSGSPRLSREAVAYLRGAADALAAVNEARG